MQFSFKYDWSKEFYYSTSVNFSIGRRVNFRNGYNFNDYRVQCSFKYSYGKTVGVLRAELPRRGSRSARYGYLRREGDLP